MLSQKKSKFLLFHISVFFVILIFSWVTHVLFGHIVNQCILLLILLGLVDAWPYLLVRTVGVNPSISAIVRMNQQPYTLFFHLRKYFFEHLLLCMFAVKSTVYDIINIGTLTGKTVTFC